ncbi:uncharacterized protein LOC123307011 [Coccinella septempunctata]|uniref:uncharacterized protein LOC123307011 n=1 Tax=Coccinella septempunctata TaxID=41139 RepID=UPI001D099071|nr:uncharacterized protein LOC123307011 [Coccinella septempunctata]
MNQTKFDKKFEMIKRGILKKVEELLNATASFLIKDSNKFIYNYTQAVLPDSVHRILSLGPKFGLPLNISEIPIHTIIKDLEYCISNLESDEDERNRLRASTTNILTNFYRRYEMPKFTKRLMQEVHETKQFLKTHTDLLVGRSEKGNSTVIMLKKDYEEKMQEMLSDRNIYKPTCKDPTMKYQKRVNEFAKKLVENQFISKTLSKKIMTHNSVPPKIYGLRKTHKENFALRPIVSCVNAPCYNLATFLHQILLPVTTTFNYKVKSSFEFVKNLNNVQLPDHYKLISLDVISLFTNIPKGLVLSTLSKRWSYISAYTNIPKKIFLEMIEFYFDSSYFSFGGNIYLQLDGSAMGNPLSPILAEIAMDELVSSVLANLPFVLPFFWLYVDDSITAVPEEEFDTILDYFNAFNPKLQFTMETERDNKLAFLDVEVHRKECGTLLTNWFTKPTSSGRILNYHSYNPIGHKLSTVKGLLHRMMNLSHHTFHDSNLRTIKNILKMNNYPNTFVNKCSNSYFRQHRAFNNSEKPSYPPSVYTRV